MSKRKPKELIKQIDVVWTGGLLRVHQHPSICFYSACVSINIHICLPAAGTSNPTDRSEGDCFGLIPVIVSWRGLTLLSTVSNPYIKDERGEKLKLCYDELVMVFTESGPLHPPPPPPPPPTDHLHLF